MNIIKTVGITRNVPEDVLKAARVARKFGLRHNGGDPEGACGIASAKLVSIMKKLGYRPSFFEGNFLANVFGGKDKVENFDEWGHCWVQWRGLIIDLTGDQFNDRIKSQLRLRAITIASPAQLEHRYKGDPCKDHMWHIHQLAA